MTSSKCPHCEAELTTGHIIGSDECLTNTLNLPYINPTWGELTEAINQNNPRRRMIRREYMTVKEAKNIGHVLPYDPHSNAGYVIIDKGNVIKDSSGHPIVYKSRNKAMGRIDELNELDYY